MLITIRFRFDDVVEDEKDVASYFVLIYCCLFIIRIRGA